LKGATNHAFSPHHVAGPQSRYALKFYQDALGLKEVRRIDNDKGRFTLVFLCAPEDEELLKKLPKTRGAPLVELTYNWDEEKYGEDRYFGHLAL
jgi:lactoylglutathione lyase